MGGRGDGTHRADVYTGVVYFWIEMKNLLYSPIVLFM